MASAELRFTPEEWTAVCMEMPLHYAAGYVCCLAVSGVTASPSEKPFIASIAAAAVVEFHGVGDGTRVLTSAASFFVLDTPSEFASKLGAARCS